LPHRENLPAPGLAPHYERRRSHRDAPTRTAVYRAGVPLLDAETLQAALRELPGWELVDGALVRTFRRADWRDAIGLVNLVADEAERRDHHPDIEIAGYRNVTFRLTSHDAGGITKRDVALARRIDELSADTRAG
jgi:4a-hydroxytetrahydrobiopterin dehydratase